MLSRHSQRRGVGKRGQCFYDRFFYRFWSFTLMVRRERQVPGAVVSRLKSSPWLRVGHSRYHGHLIQLR